MDQVWDQPVGAYLQSTGRPVSVQHVMLCESPLVRAISSRPFRRILIGTCHRRKCRVPRISVLWKNWWELTAQKCVGVVDRPSGRRELPGRLTTAWRAVDAVRCCRAAVEAAHRSVATGPAHQRIQFTAGVNVEPLESLKEIVQILDRAITKDLGLPSSAPESRSLR